MVNFYLKMYYLKQLFMLLCFSQNFFVNIPILQTELLGVGLSIQLSEPRHSQYLKKLLVWLPMADFPKCSKRTPVCSVILSL